MKQEYDHYAQEDHQVWSLLYRRQVSNLSDKASRPFLEGLQRVGFKPYCIPRFEETNTRLEALTGWQLQPVPGIVPDLEFFEMLNQRRFPATTWIRSLQQLDYLEEPDMFHDLFGHVPLLSDEDYTRFLQQLGQLALTFRDDTWRIHLLSRIYWFTVEFGLIRESGAIRIYGAGLLSSVGETQYALSKTPQQRGYMLEDVLRTAYRKDDFQPLYYVVENFEELYGSLSSLDLALDRFARSQMDLNLENA